MTRTCKAIDARLELDFDKNEVRILRQKNRVTKQNQLEDCVFSMADKMCIRDRGSFGHEFQDAQTFADWGVDFLKYDYCYKPAVIDGRLLYNRMGMALKATGRDIVFSACSWGVDDTAKWIRSTGADMWRSTGDIVDSWASVKSLFERQREIQIGRAHV